MLAASEPYRAVGEDMSAKRSIHQMIKFSLSSAGVTECLINFKHVVFVQPNQTSGKYCLSRQAGQSINRAFVLVVTSAG